MTKQAAPFVGLALRVREAREVPEGTFGLSWVAGQATKYHAGERPTVRKEGALWWVNPVTCSLRFAPDESLPEVGLCLDLAPRPGFEYALANWLASLPEVDAVGERQLVWAIRHRSGEALKHAVVPCAQNDDLEGGQRALTEALRNAMGLHCTALFRVDLAQAAVQAVDAEPCAGRGPDQDEIPPDAAAPAYAREWAANEAYAERRFFIELPKLATLIDQRRHLAGSPQDEAWRARARAAAQLGSALFQSYGGRRPQVPESSKAPGAVRLLALASRQASAGLDAAWAILAEGGEQTGLNESQISRLERALQQLQLQLERRFTAWWELDA